MEDAELRQRQEDLQTEVDELRGQLQLSKRTNVTLQGQLADAKRGHADTQEQHARQLAAVREELASAKERQRSVSQKGAARGSTPEGGSNNGSVTAPPVPRLGLQPRPSSPGAEAAAPMPSTADEEERRTRARMNSTAAFNLQTMSDAGRRRRGRGDDSDDDTEMLTSQAATGDRKEGPLLDRHVAATPRPALRSTEPKKGCVACPTCGADVPVPEPKKSGCPCIVS